MLKYLSISVRTFTLLLIFTHSHPPTHARTHTHTHYTHTCVIQDPSVTAATSAQPGAGQDDYNPFADEGVKEKESEVNDNSVICTFL